MPNPVMGPKGPLLMTTYKAGAAVVKNRPVKRGADQDSVIPATDLSVNLGVAYDNQDVIGRDVPVAHRPGEIVVVEAGAAFALDAKLKSDATGRAAAAAATNPYFAIARQAATAAGELVTCELVSAGLVA